MGLHNFYDKMNRAELPESGMAHYVPGKGHLFGWGTSANLALQTGEMVSANGDPVWAPGATYICTSTDVNYYNASTTSTPSFVQSMPGAGVVTAIDMSSAEGTITMADSTAAALTIENETGTDYVKIDTDTPLITFGADIDAAAGTLLSKVKVLKPGAATLNLEITDSGSTVILDTSTVVNLPAAGNAGVFFDFVAQTVVTTAPYVDVDGTDTMVIAGAPTSAGQKITPSAINDSVRLVDNGTVWVAIFATGTWTPS